MKPMVIGTVIRMQKGIETERETLMETVMETVMEK